MKSLHVCSVKKIVFVLQVSIDGCPLKGVLTQKFYILSFSIALGS